MAETVKAEVLKKFKDAHTGAIHEVGEVIEVTPERVAEIIAVGEFVRELEPEKPAEDETPAKDEKKASKPKAGSKSNKK